MITRREHFQAALRRWEETNGDVLLWAMMISVLSTFRSVFEGDSLTDIGLTLISGLVLGGVIGGRLSWSSRHALEHEQSHVKLTVIVTMVLWTVLVIGLALTGWATGRTDEKLAWEPLFVALTVGQLFMVLLGVIWGSAVRGIDWYPLRRTRASVIRLVVLYLVALLLLVVSGFLTLHTSRWQDSLIMAAAFLIWLGIARLWRG